MKQSRREFIKAAALAGCATGLFGSRSLRDDTETERPNILWLVSEDNSTWLGCYGDRFAQTPTLDRLAREGVRFTNCFANAPVCAPARFTIHTGVHACSAGNEHMRSEYPIPERLKFFTDHLRRAGYYCVNGQKTDYNTTGTPKGAWDERRMRPSLKGLKNRQPFFCYINHMSTHESSLHKTKPLRHDPSQVQLAPYHPDTPEIRHDYAQYYDQLNIMDGQIAAALAELEQEGLAENTIVFYFSDNGGVLPRSKRFLYDSGVHVPLIVRLPPKYAHLSPWAPGQAADRMVSYVDFAATMLSLAGVEKPEYMQGRAFLGRLAEPGPDHVFVFRGRMDEQYDLSRGVRDARFKYIRNFFPHLPWSRGLAYLSLMPAMRSWEQVYKSGDCNEVQSRFFNPKPAEELYDVNADPFEINNLAGDPNYAADLERLRRLCLSHMEESRDDGLLHETELMARARANGITPYELIRRPELYDFAALLKAADLADRQEEARLPELVSMLSSRDSGVRYWAAVGCSALGRAAEQAAPALTGALHDPSACVAIAAAEALAGMGEQDAARPVLEKHLLSCDMYEAAYAADAASIRGISGGPIGILSQVVHKKLSLLTGLNALR